MSSSRQVSPPVSRSGDNTATAQAPPTPLEPATTGQSGSSASEAKRFSPTETEEKPSGASTSSASDAFQSETSVDTKPTSFAGNRDSDPFGGLKDPGNAKVDFESAFANFKSHDQSKDSNNAFSTFSSEFPPISELERDDDSDTASEGNRFDDDFAPGSPPNNQSESRDTPKPPSSPAASKSTAVSDTPTAEGGAKLSQQSKYDLQFSDAFPPTTFRQTTNLGISDLSVFPEPPKTSPGFSAKEDDPFAPSPTATNTTSGAKKGAFDDMSDDFDGLEDAKEGSADDEFANISRSNLDDFNPVFDSSPPPSQPKSETTNVSNAFGIDSSYDFGSVSNASGTTAGGNARPGTNASSTAPVTGKPTTAPEPQDWDAIFGGEGPKNTEEANSSAKRPSTGRALTEEGKHDDPFVKDLTNMGYSRADSIRALEKYDYNLERVGRRSHLLFANE